MYNSIYEVHSLTLKQKYIQIIPDFDYIYDIYNSRVWKWSDNLTKNKL